MVLVRAESVRIEQPQGLESESCSPKVAAEIPQANISQMNDISEMATDDQISGVTSDISDVLQTENQSNDEMVISTVCDKNLVKTAVLENNLSINSSQLVVRKETVDTRKLYQAFDAIKTFKIIGKLD